MFRLSPLLSFSRLPALVPSMLFALCLCTSVQSAEKAPLWSLAIHGGAGTITPENITSKQEARIRSSLQAALAAGSKILNSGGSSLDAVEAAIVVLEDSPDFNAGKGAVFNAKAQHELDASIMDGASRNAGAVAGISSAKNPIKAARKVMEASPHVLLQGAGADEFIRTQSLELVPQSYFSTDFRRQQLKKARSLKVGEIEASSKFGTVGAVALDQHGNLAAGTSTGGMTNKSLGRVGDSPIIGAGTYADNHSCAVSGTGQGEYFIRLAVARSICAEVQYNKLSIKEAAGRVIFDQLAGLGGTGGVIAMDAKGNPAFVFNTAGMYRGLSQSGKSPYVDIYKAQLDSQR